MKRATDLPGGLLVVAGWGLFVWLWSLVIDQPYDARALRMLVAGCLVVVPVATLAWVLHNVGIHRRKGPRRNVLNIGSNYRVDFKGRRIIADWKLLDRARHVEIGVAGDLKFYRFARAVGETDPRAQAGTGHTARSTRPAELSE